MANGISEIASLGLAGGARWLIYSANTNQTYNDTYSQGAAYYTGIGAGIGISIVLGGGAAGVTRVSGLASRAGVTAQGLTRGLQAYDIAGAGVGALQSGYNVYNTGQVGLMDVAGFLPAIGWGANALRSIRRVAPNRIEFFSSGGRASQMAPEELLTKLKARGYEVFDGPDIQRHLDRMGANASTFGTKDLLLRTDPRKLEVIEEWLHNVQQRIGIDPAIRESHVADFMNRHRGMLGLDEADTLARLLFE